MHLHRGRAPEDCYQVEVNHPGGSPEALLLERIEHCQEIGDSQTNFLSGRCGGRWITGTSRIAVGGDLCSCRESGTGIRALAPVRLSGGEGPRTAAGFDDLRAGSDEEAEAREFRAAAVDDIVQAAAQIFGLH